MIEDEMRMTIEHPLTGRNVRPRSGNTEPADAPPKKDAHRDVVASLEANTLQGKPDLDRIPVLGKLTRAVPDPVSFPGFSRCGCVQSVHLNPARIDHHVIRRLCIAGGIETQSDPVIVKDVVSF